MPTDRRSELLERATDWTVQNGLHSLSLRPLAAALDTSARMLVYHFGSKERLTADVLERLAARWMATLDDQLDRDTPLPQALNMLWTETLQHPDHRGLHVLAFEAWALGLSSGDPAYRPFLDTVAAGWIARIERGLRRHHTGLDPRQSRARATLLVASVEGLLLHQLTDATLPVDDAFAELLVWLRAAA